MVIVSPLLLRLLTFGFASGIALWPFVVVKSEELKRNDRFLRHERIHLRQQIELGILPFYIWYILDYCAGRLSGMNPVKAYHNIRFEKEAYANDHIKGYLSERATWSFLKY